jgi:hypothetical protein
LIFHNDHSFSLLLSSLWDYKLWFSSNPGNELPGYFRLSLRDIKKAVGEWTKLEPSQNCQAIFDGMNTGCRPVAAGD